MGRADTVRVPGDFITLDLEGQRIILLHDATGQLRALANSRCHRVAKLIDGSGNCTGFAVLSILGFTGLRKLVTSPRLERDMADNGLILFRAESRLGFAFLCLSPNAPELDSYLEDFAELHAPLAFGSAITYP